MGIWSGRLRGLDLLMERDMINNYLDLLRTKKKNEKEGKEIEHLGGREKFYVELKGSLYVDLGEVDRDEADNNGRHGKGLGDYGELIELVTTVQDRERRIVGPRKRR